MIRRVLRHIRRQPRGVRESYALAGAAVFTASIVLVWLAYLPNRLTQVSLIDLPTSIDLEETQPAATSVGVSPFSGLFSRLQTTLTGLSNNRNTDKTTHQSPELEVSDNIPPTEPPPETETPESDTSFRIIDRRSSHATSTDE